MLIFWQFSFGHCHSDTSEMKWANIRARFPLNTSFLLPHRNCVLMKDKEMGGAYWRAGIILGCKMGKGWIGCPYVNARGGGPYPPNLRQITPLIGPFPRGGQPIQLIPVKVLVTLSSYLPPFQRPVPATMAALWCPVAFPLTCFQPGLALLNLVHQDEQKQFCLPEIC